MTIDPQREKNAPELRSQLSEVTNSHYNPDLIAQQIEALRDRVQHTIERVSDAEVSDPRPVGFNCFMYALGLANSIEARHAYAKGREYPGFPGAEFMAYFLPDCVSRRMGEEGDIVVYWQERERLPTHAGRVRHGRIVSKWGGGHVWEHGLYEVRSDYGSESRFFPGVSTEFAQSQFRAFTGERLSSAEFDDLWKPPRSV